jgi:iron(III) transport system substrate-binding protein
MSIIKSARNPEAARAWYDWALTAEAQELGEQAQAYQVPSNTAAEAPPEAPDLEQIDLIDYDFKKYGSSDERTRLLKKWDEEVGSLPR